jgi:CHAD domain-containing protein
MKRDSPPLEWKAKRSTGENCARVLPKLVRDYFKSGRDSLREGRTWEELHEFRLESKRFRYTLELFRPVYGSAVEERIQRLKELQKILGDINDAVASAELLKRHFQYSQIREHLQEKAKNKTQKLFDFWRETFDADGEEATWEAVLSGPKADVAEPSGKASD